jgi:spore maturation protein CgeB
MRILYVGMKYDYGKPVQGYSFEHYNFYHSLFNMGHEILYFDFMTLMQEHGKEWMNRRLLDVVEAEKPDLMFTVLFTEELDKTGIRTISENTDTVTLNWFCDDHWRFDNFSRHWASCFNWVITTAKSALPKYREIGYKNVIKSQWGCNPFLYRKINLPLKYDVTFVGQPHGDRRRTIQLLREAGIDFRAWGIGWDSGRLSQEEMIRVFNQSRINLNLSNASVYIQNDPIMNKAIGSIARSLDFVPFGSRIRTLGAHCILAMKSREVKTKNAGRTNDTCQNNSDQIKGRNFEIPGCGGFTLTGKADNLDEYYEIGKEVVCFKDTNDLVDKVHYYLKNEDERMVIAQAGYERTIREHTYVHRFTEIFRHIGLATESVERILGGDIKPGKTIEVH